MLCKIHQYMSRAMVVYHKDNDWVRKYGGRALKTTYDLNYFLKEVTEEAGATSLGNSFQIVGASKSKLGTQSVHRIMHRWTKRRSLQQPSVQPSASCVVSAATGDQKCRDAHYWEWALSWHLDLSKTTATHNLNMTILGPAWVPF